MARDPELLTHLEWLGYLQPVGLVVSPPALVAAQAFPAKNIIPDHTRLLEVVEEVVLSGRADAIPAVREFPRLATRVLGWEPADLLGTPEGGPLPESPEVTLTEYNETLRPSYAVPEFDRAPGGEPKWLMLVKRVELGIDLDEVPETDDKGHRWQASPQARFERLLRGTKVPIGLLTNGTHLRLVYAPHGETSGHLTFPVRAMTEVAGRPIFAAMRMLLSDERLFTLPDKQRLPAILAESRKYQNLVSTKLAEQVLAALYELLRGFQAADDQRHGELLRDVLADDPNHVYAGLLTVLLRLVFLLYAEDRSLLSNDEVYQKFYAVTGLFERLREDAGRHTDTMDHRFGAWAQLLTLFRLVYDGGRHGGLRLPARKGYLFDPDRYAFLEGRAKGSRRQPGERTDVPRVSDGVVFRVLQNLLILDGERLSYRTLDVEQIGSVYETIMGFNLEVARGRSIAVKPTKPHGAPTTVNLEELLASEPAERAKWLKEKTDQALTGQAAAALKEASTPEDAVAALERKVAVAATPRIVPAGAMVLQPSDERRRSGSHYTPRSLTEPIVETTFRPIFERLGPSPTPEQILELKVCDPAMGSGAFLVAACRFLADRLVAAWHAHDAVPKDIPPDEDETLHARRLVAQRCLYGVDKNPMAVDLAKLSLWLATLAKDHPFTFLDHALRAGDSLVGLGRDQITAFHWDASSPKRFLRTQISERLRRVLDERRAIREARDDASDLLLRQKLALAEEALNPLRLYGDAVVGAFFARPTDRARKAYLSELAESLTAYLANQHKIDLRAPVEAARNSLLIPQPSTLSPRFSAILPFHWEIEFPEVFDRENPGFDAFVGNPPFAGRATLSDANRPGFIDWLKQIHEGSHGNADLVAHFFRRCFDLLRNDGAFGLIATNTIGQGDTRSTGLRWICTHGGTIFSATRRKQWPGQAAVVVSTVNVVKAHYKGGLRLDDKPVSIITAYLLPCGGHESPTVLRENAGKSYQGSILYGMGFTFDDSDEAGPASPIKLMHELIAANPMNSERIFPFLGGDEVNNHPYHSHNRYTIFFGEMTEGEARRWPELLEIVERKVRPDRATKAPDVAAWPWWQFWRVRAELYSQIKELSEVIVINCGACPHMAFASVPSRTIFAQTLAVFTLQRKESFCILQCRVHEVWARRESSSMKDDLRYTPSDCFETFPFPENFETDPSLESSGRAYYEFRAALMARNNEGLTKTYKRFHDPDERSPDLLRLRELHAAMDRAVLDAYGWTDIRPTCEFLLDYEEDDEDESGSGGGRRRKKPWRYRWPDDVRDEVLARLLELNRQRAEQERLSGAAPEAKGKKGPRKKKRASSNGQMDMFPE
jgi:hypothetical protein